MPRFALLSLLLVAACSGGNNSSGPSPPPPPPLPLPLQDTTPPVITLTGDNPQIITTGDALTELGATATDDIDGDISGSITIDNSGVDTSTAGDYTITYTIVDAAGNSATVTRVVGVENPPLPAKPQVSVLGDIKKFIFNWSATDGVDHFRLLENVDGHSGFSQVGGNIPAGTLTTSRDISVHLTDFVNGQYIIEACNVSGCSGSDVVSVIDVMLDTIGQRDRPGVCLDFCSSGEALSADGTTLAIGNVSDSSISTGIDGDENDDSASRAGAVHLYRFDGTNWRRQAYIKASNTDANDRFGTSVALSADGNTLVVGANGEGSNATGSNGDQSDNTFVAAGAVYVFRFDGTEWGQQAFLKASNTDGSEEFGSAVSLSADGNLLAVGAPKERSNAVGINGDQSDNSVISAGAVYVFRFDGANWGQEAYVKASNTGEEQDGNTYEGDLFGSEIALSADGNALVIGAPWEDSGATGVNGEQFDESGFISGAAYLYRFNGTEWSHDVYFKPTFTMSIPDPRGFWGAFGSDLSLSADGNTLAVGAWLQDIRRVYSGEVYVFQFDGVNWSQSAQIADAFTAGLNADGTILAVGYQYESSRAIGINGDPNDIGSPDDDIGAARVFQFDGATWNQNTYVKAPGPDDFQFGNSVYISADASILVVLAYSTIYTY